MGDGGVPGKSGSDLLVPSPEAPPLVLHRIAGEEIALQTLTAIAILVLVAKVLHAVGLSSGVSTSAGVVALLCVASRMTGRSVTIDHVRREIVVERLTLFGAKVVAARFKLTGTERCVVRPEQRAKGGGRIGQEPVMMYRLHLVVGDGEESIPLAAHISQVHALTVRDSIEAYIAAGRYDPAQHPAYTHPAAPTPEVKRIGGKGVCQVCGVEIVNDWVDCPKCETPHHESCWKYNGGCSTYACQR